MGKHEHLTEGDECPECDAGALLRAVPEDCSCHISPPCSACIDAPLVCDECGEEFK